MRPQAFRESFKAQLAVLGAQTVRIRSKADVEAGRAGFVGWVSPALHDVEHFRFPALITSRDEEYERETWIHAAVVVGLDGACSVGTATPSFVDTYSRKIGYAVSVGRALVAHITEVVDFRVDTALVGTALRDACRVMCLAGLKAAEFPLAEDMDADDDPDDLDVGPGDVNPASAEATKESP
jgi:hypothetical protein